MCAKKKDPSQRHKEIRNSKAFHDYTIVESFEAGIALKGTEIKSIRAGKAQINDAFARFEKGEIILHHAHINEYKFGADQNHNPTRPRKLLLHKREINRLRLALDAGGHSLIPLKMYFKGSLLKVALGLCKGKKLYDKRQDLKKKEAKREADRYLKDLKNQQR